jgi:hypothetical protein
VGEPPEDLEIGIGIGGLGTHVVPQNVVTDPALIH